HLDELFEPVDDEQKAVVVDDADVAGMQPPVRVDGARRSLGVVEIALHDLRPADPDLAGLVRAEIPARFRADDSALRVRYQRAGLAGTALVRPRVMRGRARFGHAVALPHSHAEARLDC